MMKSAQQLELKTTPAELQAAVTDRTDAKALAFVTAFNPTTLKANPFPPKPAKPK
jgi:hypothetical protein